MDATINPSRSEADRLNAVVHDLAGQNITVTAEETASGNVEVTIQETPLSMAATNAAIDDAMRSVGLLDADTRGGNYRG